MFGLSYAFWPLMAFLSRAHGPNARMAFCNPWATFSFQKPLLRKEFF
jgi:hypothetical protein